jgi:hypothetical protein
MITESLHGLKEEEVRRQDMIELFQSSSSATKVMSCKPNTTLPNGLLSPLNVEEHIF